MTIAMGDLVNPRVEDDNGGGSVEWLRDRSWVVREMARQGRVLEELNAKVERIDGRVDALDKSTDLGFQDLRFRQTVVGALTIAIPSIIGVVFWYLSHR